MCQVGSRDGMSVSKGYWGSQRPKPQFLTPQTGENPALICAWTKQGCTWRIEKPNGRFDSVLCLAEMKNKNVPTNPDTYKRKFNIFFSDERRWGCSFLVLWAFTYKLLCNGSALLLFSVLLMSCTKGQGLSKCCCGQWCDPVLLSLPRSPLATQVTRHPKKQSVTSTMPEESCPSSNEVCIPFPVRFCPSCRCVIVAQLAEALGLCWHQ